MLDRDHLRELTDGDAEFERELIAAYTDSARSLITNLRSCLTTRDTVGMAREAHALKGASLNVGAMSLAKCCAQIETDARSGDSSHAGQQLEQLIREEQELWEELESLHAEPA